MLIMNNGTPKSGSTWINKIVRLTLDIERPAQKWRREDWNSDSVHPVQLKEFIETGAWKKKDILFKTHITYRPRFKYLLQPGIKIIVTYRNLPDSIVSLFHHQIRHEKTKHTEIDIWFRKKGYKIGLFLNLYMTNKRAQEITQATQVRLNPGEKPKENSHTRTGGQSRAHIELPPKILARLERMEKRAGLAVSRSGKF